MFRVSGFLLIFLGACASEAEIPTSQPQAPAKTTAQQALADIQVRAATDGRSPYLHWGADSDIYAGYDSHSNRFVPVYVLGAGTLSDYAGVRSPYRDATAIKDLYGYLPENTLSPNASYLDQTNVFDIQSDALDAGIEHIFLVVFDGMDYPNLRLAMLAQSGEWTKQGPGAVFSFQSHRPPGAWEFGYAVTSPFGESPEVDVDSQSIGTVIPSGGYNPKLAGFTPWDKGEPLYLNGRSGHTVTDSATSAVAITSGRKTYNGSINIGPNGEQLTTIAQLAQKQGYAAGTVSSVPFNHATPAAAYAHNVSRGDYQDIARDMLGLPSVAHPERPLPGLDVVMGAGIGVRRDTAAQGTNYIPGNRYLAAQDLERITLSQGGKYATALRTSGLDGSVVLKQAVERALENEARLFAWFGTRYAHLPFATTNGDYNPVVSPGGRKEKYTAADLNENPTLEEMTQAAIEVLSQDPQGFWLMVESGDVDWAAHDNNVDNMVGAVFSGDKAVEAIIRWVESNSNWNESVLIVTADHGHLLYVDDPSGLAEVVQP